MPLPPTIDAQLHALDTHLSEMTQMIRIAIDQHSQGLDSEIGYCKGGLIARAQRTFTLAQQIPDPTP